MKTLLLKWWLFLCTQAAIGGIAFYFGFFNSVLEKDPTRLSLFILGILILTTLWLGKKIYSMSKIKNPSRDIKDELHQDFSIGWFVAECCLVLGLVGTVCGFIIMLGTAFVDIDVSNIDSMQKALTQMSIGMSAALYTTLMGLLSSLVIKLQLVNVERTIDQT